MASAAPGAPSDLEAVEGELRDFALAFPEAQEDFPWGHRALKVRGKVFVFLYRDAEGLSLSAKLPASSEAALLFPFAEPTGYGLGKSGWVTARFAPAEAPPLSLLREWIEESYRAVAPKRLAAQLGGAAPAPKARRPRG